MRKVVVQEFVTLNGLAAGPDGNLDFVPASTQGDEAFGRDQLAFIDTIDTILLGSVTYRMLAGYWPHVTAGAEKLFADKLNATPKVVFSRTLDRAPWGTWSEARIVSGALPDEVAKLKDQAGKDIAVWGSLSLVQSLIKAGLVDEYRLVVCPVVLEGGRPLFDQSPSIMMTPINVNPLDRGAVALRYVPLTAGAATSREDLRRISRSPAL
jgi:dihydrofolate reductase